MYPIGSRLWTLDGTKVGNGIIIGYHPTPLSYQVESDFGNIYFVSAQELDDMFSVDDSEPDTCRWYSDREELRSRSSMLERPPVQRKDVG